jgi:carbon-monoxide dehydrogenase large subunit
MEPGLEAQVTYDPPNFTFPFGTHVAVVEVDSETGDVDLVRYVAVDDCGNQVNPMIVEGQVHGGVVQGIAQALYEEAVYDQDGNLRTSTLTDYLVPSAPRSRASPWVTRSRRAPPTPWGSRGWGRRGRSRPPPRS